MSKINVQLPEALVRQIVDACVITQSPSMGNIERRARHAEHIQHHVWEIVCAIVWKQARTMNRIWHTKK